MCPDLVSPLRRLAVVISHRCGGYEGAWPINIRILCLSVSQCVLNGITEFQKEAQSSTKWEGSTAGFSIQLKLLLLHNFSASKF